MSDDKSKEVLAKIKERLSQMSPQEVIDQLHKHACVGPTVDEFIEGFDWPKVYLAGFDVFRKDGLERGAYLKGLCRESGMDGLYPFDNEVDSGLPPAVMAATISQMNMDMIRRADAVLANLNCFRGLEPDSGTVFEVGMAIALGKPVWVYFDGPETLRNLVPHDAEGFDAEGFMVEDFGLPMNLMLACTWAGHSKTVELAVPALAELLWGEKKQKERQKEAELQAYIQMIDESEAQGLDWLVCGACSYSGVAGPHDQEGHATCPVCDGRPCESVARDEHIANAKAFEDALEVRAVAMKATLDKVERLLSEVHLDSGFRNLYEPLQDEIEAFLNPRAGQGDDHEQ